MAGKELVVAKPKALTVKQKEDLPLSILYYEREGTTDYSFSKVFDQQTSVCINPTEREYQESEFYQADFEETVKESHKEYYCVAAACGLLSASLSSVSLSDLFELKGKLEDKDLEKYVVAAARIAGYKKNDYKGAVQFLRRKAVPFVKVYTPPQVLNYFNDLSNNPKLSGLIFSIISQFTGDRYEFDEKDRIKKSVLPKYYAIGNTPAEKVFYGFLYWVFALAVNAVISKKSIFDDLHLNGIHLLRILEDYVSIPLMKEIPTDLTDAERKYSAWIKKMFEDSEIIEVDGSKTPFNLMHMIKGVVVEGIESSVPVILNECLFRGFYFIRRMTYEVKAKNITSFQDLYSIDPHDVLPFNNQVVSRMAVIASGTFVAADLTCAAIKAFFKKKNGAGKSFKKAFLAEVNIAGIGRFALAVGADSKYWIESVKVLFVRKNSSDNVIDYDDILAENPDTNAVFEVLSLEAVQARVLYCFEAFAVLEDIKSTKNEKDKQRKKQWLHEWQAQIVKGLEYQDDDFFNTSLEELHRFLKDKLALRKSQRWIYLLTLELALFKAYQPIGSEYDSVYSKLKFDGKAVERVYLNKQKLVTAAEWKNIKDDYAKHYGMISGKTQSVVLSASISVVVIALSGGLASIFAPNIAVLLAGEAVAGLHGAALTSASLALVGGGAVAAGGGGMAAGAAIITGGGALLGAVGSGSGSAIAALAQTNPGIWARQGAKLATFCSAVLHDILKADAAVSSILTGTEETIEKAKTMIDELESEDEDLDKEFLKVLKKYLQYLERTGKEIAKVLK